MLFKSKRQKPRWKTREAKLITEIPPEKMSVFKEFSIKAAKAVDLPVDFCSGNVHLEFSGNREVVVEGCCGVLEYDENITTLDLGKMKIRFLGRDIELRNFTEHSVIVDGFISTVEFLI